MTERCLKQNKAVHGPQGFRAVIQAVQNTGRGNTKECRMREFTQRVRIAHAPCAHRVGHSNKFSREWSTFEALVNTVPWWQLLQEECGRV